MPKKAVETEPLKRRLNVELPINLHNRFKAACAKHDRKMVDVVLELIARRTEELERRA
jgi:ParG